ncbi:MAG: PAS domain-containing protein [Chloroflexaceae bacterium]
MTDQPTIDTLHQENQHLRERLAELEQREAHFREFVERTDDMITQVDHTGSFTYVNATTARLFGLAREECLGRSAFEFTHPDDLEMTQQAFMGWVQNQERSVSFENRQISIHGDVYLMLWSITLHYDADGNLAYANSICRNTSEIKRLEAELRDANTEFERRMEEQTAALRQNQEMLRAIVDNAPVAISVTDLEGHYTVMNRYMRQTFDVTEAQVLNQHYHDILPPALIEPVDAAVEHVKANNATVTQESTVELPEGARFYQTSLFPISDNSGRIVAVGAVATDITERKQVLEAQRRLVALIENSTDFIGISSLEGHAQYVNQAGRAMMGLDGLEAVHQTNVPEYYVPEDRVWIERDVLPQVFSTGIWSGEVRFKNFATGEVIPVHHTLFIIRDQDSNEPMAVGTISRDITEQKRQQEELHLARFALDGAADEVFWIDFNGQIIYVNEVACRNLGYTREELLTLRVPDLDPNFLPEAVQELWNTIVAQGFMTVETVHLRKDSSTYPTEVMLSVFQFDDQNLFCAFSRDITERKQQEAERETMQQQIIAAQRNALRELSTPLIPITDEVVIMMRW